MTRAVDVKLTLVIPCFNEARRLDPSAFSAFLAREPLASLLFVDDGSVDDTRARLTPLAQEFPARVTVLTLPTNRGKAEAVRAGMIAARATDASVIGFWDADLATPLDAVADLLEVLQQQATTDWVIGSRVRLLGRRIDRHALRHYVGRVFATAASLVVSMPVYDTQCGAKLFRATPELDAVLSRPFLSRWVFDVEMILRLVHKRGSTAAAEAAIHEFPLRRWSDVGDSKVRTADFFLALTHLFRLSRLYR